MQAKVTSVRQNEGVVEICLSAGEVPLTMVALEGALDVHNGAVVEVGWQASHVVLSTSPNSDTTICNTIPCRIKSLKMGEIIATATLSSSLGEFESIVTARSAKRLNLSQGSNVYALIKATNVYLEGIVTSHL